MHYIYKFTNKINGRCYVGQTNDLHKRYNGHKSVAYNPKAPGYYCPFYRAIRKYGLENFTYETLEEISDEKDMQYVDKREKFFIQYYHSLSSEKGYNVALGGNGRIIPPLTYEEKLDRSRLFTKEEILDIQKRLIDGERLESIKKSYEPRLKSSFLCNINTGQNFYNPEFKYPLNPYPKSCFTKQQIQEIKDRIKSGEQYASIRKDYGIKSDGFLSMVNTGKYFHSEEDTYPLCNKGCRKQDNEIWVNGIISDIINTDLSLTQIAKNWNKCYATVKNINAGRAHKKKDLHYPLR